MPVGQAARGEVGFVTVAYLCQRHTKVLYVNWVSPELAFKIHTPCTNGSWLRILLSRASDARRWRSRLINSSVVHTQDNKRERHNSCPSHTAAEASRSWRNDSGVNGYIYTRPDISSTSDSTNRYLLCVPCNTSLTALPLPSFVSKPSTFDLGPGYLGVCRWFRCPRAPFRAPTKSGRILLRSGSAYP